MYVKTLAAFLAASSIVAAAPYYPAANPDAGSGCGSIDKHGWKNHHGDKGSYGGDASKYPSQDGGYKGDNGKGDDDKYPSSYPGQDGDDKYPSKYPGQDGDDKYPSQGGDYPKGDDYPQKGSDYPQKGSDYPYKGHGYGGHHRWNSTKTAYPVGGYPTGTPSTGSYPSSVSPPMTGVTHRVAAGFNGLHFEPNNIVANVGDIVEVKFLPKNHSIAQSSFDQPCKPLVDESGAESGFFAGFNFFTQNGLAPDVFQITVTDTKPIWFYCPQTKDGHCQAGMAGVVNQNVDSGKTLDKYIAAAAMTGTSIVPSAVRGGVELPNPNPNSGFP